MSVQQRPHASAITLLFFLNRYRVWMSVTSAAERAEYFKAYPEVAMSNMILRVYSTNVCKSLIKFNGAATETKQVISVMSYSLQISRNL